MDTEQQPREATQDKATSSPSRPPSSAAASPSHEFSFSISFQHPLNLTSAANTLKTSTNKYSTAVAAVDLAPADDIFLHGHLLPLHLLSHPSSPPRTSDITLENLTLPLGHVDSDRHLNYLPDAAREEHKERSASAKGSKIFASFFGLGRPRKRGDAAGEKQEEEGKRKRKGFDVARLLRKYASLMEAPMLLFRGEREKRGGDLRRRPYSFNGHSNRREQAEGWRKRKGQFSAPASTRTSPTNSGLLSAASMTFSSSDSSTMEELQSAIQAAIAHCKNSVAAKQRGET